MNLPSALSREIPTRTTALARVSSRSTEGAQADGTPAAVARRHLIKRLCEPRPGLDHGDLDDRALFLAQDLTDTGPLGTVSPQIVRNFLAGDGPADHDGGWTLALLALSDARRSESLSTLHTLDVDLQELAHRALEPAALLSETIAGLLRDAVKGGRAHLPAADAATLLFWDAYTYAVTEALASPWCRDQMRSLVRSGQLAEHMRAVGLVVGSELANLPVLIAADDKVLEAVGGAQVDGLTVPAAAVILNRCTGRALEQDRGTGALNRTLVHELVHTAQPAPRRTESDPKFQQMALMLNEGSTELITSAVMLAMAEERGTVRPGYTWHDRQASTYHANVVLVSTVLDLARLPGCNPLTAVDLCLADAPISIVQDWLAGSDPRARADVRRALAGFLRYASALQLTESQRIRLQLQLIDSLGEIRSRRGLTAPQAECLSALRSRTAARLVSQTARDQSFYGTKPVS